ncbi:MAG: glycosyltransferase family 4 protein, partial [Anaerolineae bacterium]
KADLCELFNVPPQRVTVVYAGYDPGFTSIPSSSDSATLTQLGITKPYILGLGTLQPRKNFSTLIRAYHQLIEERHIPHQLVIGGGKGWLYEDIFATVQELKLAERVLFLGYVQDEKLPALYRGADVFAFPSLYEGFGIPILEAMGCGTPVVTANTSSLPEVAGEAALQVNPQDSAALADAIWRIIDDTALRESLVCRGFERIKVFSWRTAAETLLKVYHSALL